MIKLGRVRIENFKSFINPINFNFTNQDLIIFDGPNGFGKTTIFDAIELCFTGRVSRITPTDTKTKKTHILKGDDSKPTSIKMELLYEGNTVIVIETIIPTDISGDDRKINNYQNTIQRFEFTEWDYESTDNYPMKVLDEGKLKLLLKNKKIDSTFTLFNYIQQEETCHFLRIDEKERHKKISYLFGTINESEKLNKLDLLVEKIKDKIDYYKPIIERDENELSKLSNPDFIEGNSANQIGSGKIVSLTNLESCTVEQIDSYISNLTGIDWILKNKESYKALKFNHSLKKITNEKKKELRNLIKFGMINDYKEIEKLNKQYSSWEKTNKKSISYERLLNIYNLKPNSLDNETLIKYIQIFPKECSKFSLDIERLKSTINNSNSFNKILISIEESRKNLIIHYKNHLGDNNNEDIHCPLCGDEKISWVNLQNEYNKQTMYFEELLGDNGKQLASITEKLIKELISPLALRMKRFITRYKSYINYEFDEIKKIKSISKQDFENMNSIKNWLIINIDGYTYYQDSSLRDYRNDYDEITNQLILFIENLAKRLHIDAPKNYLAFTNDLNTFDEILDANGEIVIDSVDIANDLRLLKQLLVKKNSHSYKEKEEKIIILRKKIEKLSLKRREIMAISEVYRNEIKAYEKDIAKHIAIPFFIYSSKILQSRPEGSGVFLITPDTNRANGFIQFRSTPNDSHDAWNTMSSGQLSGVVISFTLAMNKVYPSNLSTILIDDPVQTMDEVNMASFVQMMKYEFPDIQLLLSTHESKVANYFSYKYNEAGLNTLPINMKKKRLEF